MAPIKFWFLTPDKMPCQPALILTKEAFDLHESREGVGQLSAEIRQAWREGKIVWMENRCPFA